VGNGVILGAGTLLSTLAAPVSAAGVSSYGLEFSAKNLNPWDVGTASNVSKKFDLFSYSWDKVKLPTINGDPGGALLDVLGLGDLASVTLGASTSGKIGLNAGYDVNGGTLNLSYAGHANVSAPDTYVYGKSLEIGTNFNQGPVQYISFLNGQNRTATSGFSTTTPYADVYANLNLSVNAGATLEGCLLLYCADATINFPGVSYQQQLLDANTATGINALGVDVLKFGQTTDLGGWGSLTVNTPKINVTGTPQVDGTLRGSAVGNILDLKFNGDQLIPVIGPLLKNNIGPLGYTLVSFTPEATLGVYQNLEFLPNVKAELQFSDPMLQILADGTKKIIDAGAPVTVNAGDPFNLRPIAFQSYVSNSLTVKPTYSFDAKIHNTTGLTLGGDLEVDGLALNTPFGDVGPLPNPPPIPVFTVNIPLWENLFPVNVAPIALPTFEIANGNPLFKQLVTNGGFKYNPLAAPDPITGNTSFKFTLEQATGFTEWTTNGHLISSSPECDGIHDQAVCNTEQFFVADSDVVVDLWDANNIDGFVPTNLGSVFCVVCNDATSYLDALSDSLLDGITGDNNPVFVTDPALYLTGDNSNPNDPWLTEDHVINSLTSTPLSITVPVPGTLALFGIGLAGLVRRRVSAV